MKNILAQTWNNLIKRPVLSISIVIMLTAGLFLLAGTAAYIQDSEGITGDFLEAYSPDSARRLMHMSNELVFNKLNDEDGAKFAKKYLNELRAAVPDVQFVRYTYVDYMPVIRDYRGPDSLLAGYYDGTPQKNLDYSHSGLGENWSALPYIVTEQAFFDCFNVRVTSGRDFSGYSEEDWLYSPDGVYPVLMGADLADYYSLGDIIDVVYDTACRVTMKCEVIGFLARGQTVLGTQSLGEILIINENEQAGDQLLYLDNHLILPMLDFSEAGEYISAPHQWIGLNKRGYGMFLAVGKMKHPEMVQKINIANSKIPNPLHESLFMSDSVSSSAVMAIPVALYDEIDFFFDLLYFCSVFILVACLVCISVNLINKLNDNFKKYAVHLLCGASLKDIRKITILEVLIFLIVSSGLALAALAIFGAELLSFSFGSIYQMSIAGVSVVSVVTVLAVDAAVAVCALIIPVWRINTCEYDTLLRGRNS